ncbi:MAG: hypothetical protein C0475_07330 [Planctomyces sp.]|nr:hypothetical protein [Planctomyces sp.]
MTAAPIPATPSPTEERMSHHPARPSVPERTQRRRAPAWALCAAAAVLAAFGRAGAQGSVSDLQPGPNPRWALVLNDASVLGVRAVAWLGQRGASVVLADGTETELPPGRVLGLVPFDWADADTGATRRDWDASDLPGLDTQPAPARARFELVDGAVVLGAVSRRVGDADAVAIETNSVGTLSVPLERLRAVLMAGSRGRSAPPGPAQRDAVTLTNGDRLEGFVQSIGIGPGGAGQSGPGARPDPSIEVDVGRRVESVPLTRVAEVALANPAAEPTGPRLWTTDGGVLPVDDAALVSVSQIRLRLRTGPAGYAEHVLASSQARALVLDSARVIGLARLTLLEERSLPDRPWPGSVAVGPIDGQIVSAATVRVPGEIEAEWALPAGSAWFTAGVLIPASDRVLGQSAVRVLVGVPGGGDGADGGGGAGSAGGGGDELEWRQLGELRLDGATPLGRLRVPLGAAEGEGVPAGSRLRVSVTGGAAGVVQSGVELRRALITVAEPAGPRSPVR